jgi:hypothetical protein
MQVVASMLAYWPALQAVQEAEPAVETKPTAQLVHVLALLPDQVPPGHIWQSTEAGIGAS